MQDFGYFRKQFVSLNCIFDECFPVFAVDIPAKASIPY